MRRIFFLGLGVIFAGCSSSEATKPGPADLNPADAAPGGAAPDAAVPDADAPDAAAAPDFARVPLQHLWIAYETNAVCVAEVEGFFHCLLERSSFNALAAGYPNGYPLAYGSSAPVPAACGKDFQCVVDAAKFPVSDLDVVLIIYAGEVGGQNDWAVTVKSGGRTVHIHGAYEGDASTHSNPCKDQTVYGMHEVFEAIADPAAADCCDGEIPEVPDGGAFTGCLNWCSQCAPSCIKYGPKTCGGNNNYGIATLDCGNGQQYFYQYISPATDEFGGTCVPLTVP